MRVILKAIHHKDANVQNDRVWTTRSQRRLCADKMVSGSPIQTETTDEVSSHNKGFFRSILSSVIKASTCYLNIRARSGKYLYDCNFHSQRSFHATMVQPITISKLVVSYFRFDG